MEWKIGEIRQVNGEWYQCLESDRCNYCDLEGLFDCHNIACASGERSDSKDVIFKKLEKVGEPYEHYGKLYQCYKLLVEIEIRLLPDNCYPVGKDNLVEIEIKQTKEDMEEKNNAKHSNSEKIGKNLKPFDLQKAIEGKPVCTRDGRKARIICFDAKGDKPIIALIEMGVAETPNNYPIDGKAISTKETPCDLMMLPEKRIGWININKDAGLFKSKEEAERDCTKDYATVRVEFEI